VTIFLISGVRGDWYFYSDLQYNKASPSEVLSSPAYLLFYERKSATKPNAKQEKK
jgi:ubiquitin C-terminal hydrolase